MRRGPGTPRRRIGVRGDAPHLPLHEQVLLVIEERNVAEVNARDGEGSPSFQTGQGHRHQLTCGGEDDRRVDRLRRQPVAGSHRVDADRPGEITCRRCAGQDVDGGSLSKGNLRREVGRRPEAVDRQPTSGGKFGACFSERYPMMPAHSSGAACTSSNESGSS